MEWYGPVHGVWLHASIGVSARSGIPVSCAVRTRGPASSAHNGEAKTVESKQTNPGTVRGRIAQGLGCCEEPMNSPIAIRFRP